MEIEAVPSFSQAGLDEEPWRVDFWTREDGEDRHICVDGVSSAGAHHTLRVWRRQRPNSVITFVDDITDEQHQHLVTKMTKLRIMPMREAV